MAHLRDLYQLQSLRALACLSYSPGNFADDGAKCFQPPQFALLVPDRVAI
jgi:hypothetical protein